MCNHFINIIFANNLKKQRYKLGVSQERLAELCGLHRTFIGLIERSNRNITLKNAKKIADALQVDIKDLLIGESKNEH